MSYLLRIIDMNRGKKMKKKNNLFLKKISTIALTIALGLGLYKHIQRKNKEERFAEKIQELNTKLADGEQVNINDFDDYKVTIYDKYLDDNNNLDESITELSIEEPDESEIHLPDPNSNEEIVNEYIESLIEEEVQEKGFQYTR